MHRTPGITADAAAPGAPIIVIPGVGTTPPRARVTAHLSHRESPREHKSPFRRHSQKGVLWGVSKPRVRGTRLQSSAAQLERGCPDDVSDRCSMWVGVMNDRNRILPSIIQQQGGSHGSSCERTITPDMFTPSSPHSGPETYRLSFALFALLRQL